MYGAKSPRNSKSNTAYAVPASKGDASSHVGVRRTPAAISGVVTSLHVFPWSRVTWAIALEVPIQMTPGRTVDAAIDQRFARRGMLVSLGAGRAGVTVRSGLSFVQVAPPSGDAITY